MNGRQPINVSLSCWCFSPCLYKSNKNIPRWGLKKKRHRVDEGGKIAKHFWFIYLLEITKKMPLFFFYFLNHEISQISGRTWVFSNNICSTRTFKKASVKWPFGWIFHFDFPDLVTCPCPYLILYPCFFHRPLISRQFLFCYHFHSGMLYNVN